VSKQQLLELRVVSNQSEIFLSYRLLTPLVLQCCWSSDRYGIRFAISALPEFYLWGLGWPGVITEKCPVKNLKANW